MKQKILNIILFIPATIALVFCRITVNIPWVKYWVVDQICELMKSKEEKEIYLIALSEAPKSENVENLGRWTLTLIEHIGIKIKILENLFGIKEEDYIHILIVNRIKD